MIEIDSAEALEKLKPDFDALLKSQNQINGVLVTALCLDTVHDFHYRYFWPWSGTNEDPVTGGVQTFLARYWALKLNKNRLRAFQSSFRTGSMDLDLFDDKVSITSQAVIMLEGSWMA